VVAHQDEGVDPPAGAFTDFAQCLEETLPIGGVAKNRFAPIAPVKQMIDRSGEFETGFSGHPARRTKISQQVE
jgi:hypothetical protein